ncbi:aminopeptidase-like protein Y [Pseudovirgaria hyperparasitica]|uniref:Peptide hydrolase n=1 Tax=Pseudovirgaria hyperparasitica TaxID=470096 RepID=A0A6A6WIT1_9PEZI|nr:aminopeptidase-like protein Y [Pseudovirgaria hyperparasitica]KAF2761980.1 aminopeptidase-like protein Y [Pseudovirgaria hyperparasitica]
MRFIRLSAAVAALVTLAHAQDFAISESWRSLGEKKYAELLSKLMQRDIKTDKLMSNLVRLDTIANENGGNRAFGLPGYAASVDFIWSRVGKIRGTKAWKQDFPALFNNVDSISFIVNDIPYYVYGLTYSPSTSAEGITAPLVLGPLDTTACTVDGLQNYDLAGKILLGQRGTCPDGTTLAGRVRAGKAAGAAAVILFNNVPTNTTAGTLSAPDEVNLAPAGFINLVDGEAIAAQLREGQELTAYFQQTQTIETRTTQNIFVETNGGDPNNIIMLGAHLDSVKAGPGINDDGSGTTLILEIFDALRKYPTKNKVRFAWWGAEENGLVGSEYFCEHLTPEESDKILAYLNFDMVSRGYYGVFDGDGSTHGLAGAPGSDTIEKIFYDDLTSKGINVTAARFTGGSDYAPFMQVLGKPVGGLHTGTGVTEDDCYHQACDTIKNPNPEQLTINAKTAANTLAQLAVRGTELIPKVLANSTMAMPRDLPQIQWSEFDEERHLAGCGHDI